MTGVATYQSQLDPRAEEAPSDLPHLVRGLLRVIQADARPVSTPVTDVKVDPVLERIWRRILAVIGATDRNPREQSL